MEQDGAEDRLAAPLPLPVRQRVVELAAEALGGLPLEEVPGPLRPFRGFTPAKRARLAGTPIATSLDGDAAFRLRVSACVREVLPALADALTAGHAPPAADPVEVAAVAYLLRPDDWRRFVGAARADLDRDADAAGSTAAAAQSARLTAQLTSARTQARADVERLRGELAASKSEVADLRRRLHAAREGRRAAEEEVTKARADVATASSAAETALRRMRARLAEAEASLETGRRTVREGRAGGDTRLRLLLDTIIDASQGLRRELALPPAAPGAPRPADGVVAALPAAPGVDDVAEQARAADDPALLDELLGLPLVHLVIDGYNVTKLGYGSLPLQVQRERLVAGLATLAARTGAEVTCCFDGAAVETPVAMAVPRGVRVLFSLPGETADELIRRLAAHEPPGRPVVVVSSDREVADGVRRSGARPVPAAMLLKRLARG